MKSQPEVYISLGSNLGDSIAILRAALFELETLANSSLTVSSLWQTAPVDCPPGSLPFINAVAGLAPYPDETPESLLHKLQLLEQKFGRAPKTVLNEPRSLDLDLIVFGSQTRQTPFLTLPHPRAVERKFVLAPLAEIAPDLVLPGQHQTVEQLLQKRAGDPHNVQIIRNFTIASVGNSFVQKPL